MKRARILILSNLCILVAVSGALMIFWFFSTESNSGITVMGREISTNFIIITILIILWYLVLITVLLQVMVTQYEKSKDEMREKIENQRDTERNLQESEEKFKSLVEYAFEPITILDMQGIILFVNRAIADMLEVSDPAWLIGRNILEFVAPMSHQAVIDDFIKVSEGLDGFVAEYQVITAKRNQRYVESIGKTIVYQGRSADLVSIRDVTFQNQNLQKLEKQNEIIIVAYNDLSLVEEQVRANYNDLLLKERELRESEERFRESEEMFRNPVEHSPVGMFLALEGFFRYANPCLAHMFDYPVEILLQTPLKSLFSSADDTGASSYMDAFNNIGSCESFYELKGLRSDGSPLDLEVYTATMPYQGQMAVYGTIIDVSYRKEIEKARLQSEKMYRLITENMQDVVWILDPETWYFRYVSPSVQRLRGYTADEVISQPVAAALDPFVFAALKDSIETKRALFLQNPSIKKYYITQLPQPCKGGSLVMTEVVTNFFINEETGRIEILGVSRDITDRKKAEMEIEKKSLEVYEKNEVLCATNEELTAIEEERRKAYEELTRKQELLAEHQDSLRNAQAIAHLGNWEWKIRENNYLASEEFCRIFGFMTPESTPSFEELVSHLSVPDQSLLRDLITTLRKSGSTESIFITILLSDGTERTLQVRGKARYSADNVVDQISLIVLDVTRQKQMESDLFEAAREKEILLREIHHRVKNNMQVISSLISLQSRSLTDSSAKNLFKDTQTRVRTLSLVHEMLYKSDNLNNIDYRKYLQGLSYYLLDSYHVSRGMITCLIPDHDVQISIEKAVPCSLIITELVTNSLKYAFPSGNKGEISIDFQYHPESSEYILDYQDNGQGFSEGMNNSEGSGFGSTLIHGLTRQLSGTIWIAETGPGVHYRITFPNTEKR